MSIVEGGVIGVPTDVRVFGDVGLSGGDGGEPVGDDEAGTGVADGEAPREVGAGADDDIGCVCHISNITYYRGNTSPYPNRYNWTGLGIPGQPLRTILIRFITRFWAEKNPTTRAGKKSDFFLFL